MSLASLESADTLLWNSRHPEFVMLISVPVSGQSLPRVGGCELPAFLGTAALTDAIAFAQQPGTATLTLRGHSTRRPCLCRSLLLLLPIV